MNRTDEPKKQPVVFGVNGQRETLLLTTPAGDNTASYDAGFPPVTMILKAAGGLPPKGQDMNQILFELSALGRWFSAGAIAGYDATFSTAIGGYPKGAEVVGSDGTTRYLNTVDANTTNPNTGGAGWFNLTSGYLQTANNLSDLTNITIARTSLGLGSAAQRAVGTGTDQIPDMNSFSYTVVGPGAVIRLPGGIIIQQGQLTTDANGFYQVNLGVAMSTYQVIASEGLVDGWTASGGLFSFLTAYGTQIINSTQFNVRSASWRSSDKNFIAQSTICNYLAIGRV